MILSPDNRPSRLCHAVTLAETPSGLVAAWFGERRDTREGAGIWLARQISEGWTSPKEVVGSTAHGHPPQPCWNPVLFQHPAGPLLLFYKAGLSTRTWRGWLTRSADGGLTWDTPRPLGTGPLGPLLGPIKNKPVLLPDGRLICASSIEPSRGWRAHFELSHDLEHWQTIGPIDDPLQLDAIQPCVMPLPDGRLLALCRARRRIIARSESVDGGLTWSALAATTLPNPDSGIDAVALADGRLMLVYNDSARQRTPLVVAISEDGEHWRNVHTLESGVGEFSYPAVIQGKGGKVHIAYSWHRLGIGYATIEPSKIPLFSALCDL